MRRRMWRDEIFLVNAKSKYDKIKVLPMNHRAMTHHPASIDYKARIIIQFLKFTRENIRNTLTNLVHIYKYGTIF